MSELPANVDFKLEPVRIKITQCTSSAPQCWYKQHIGEVLNVDRKTWYENGKQTHQYYVMKSTPGSGFDGHISPEDAEEVYAPKEGK